MNGCINFTLPPSPIGIAGYSYSRPFVPVKHTGKIYTSLFLILVFLVLAVMSSCMMPELSPGYSFGTITVDKPGDGTQDKPAGGDGTQDKPDVGKVPGEEYLKITEHPASFYFKDSPNPGSNWSDAGLKVHLMKSDDTDGGDVTGECDFTPVDMGTPGIQEITVSRGNKTAVFSIAVLDRTAPLSQNMFYVAVPPDKLTYHPGESGDWTGLEVVEISYDGNPAMPPAVTRYIYPDDAIKVVTSLKPADFGPKQIMVIKSVNPEKSTFFDVVVNNVTWYVEAGGEGDGYTLGTPLPSIEAALAEIKTAYAECSDWQETDVPAKANIVISGVIDLVDYVDVNINRNEYPPLHFKGSQGGGSVVNMRVNRGGNAVVTYDKNLIWKGDYLDEVAYRDMVSATRGASSVTIEGNSDYYFPSNPGDGFCSFKGVDYPIFDSEIAALDDTFWTERLEESQNNWYADIVLDEEDTLDDGIYALFYNELIVNKGAFRNGQTVTLNNFLIAQCETTYDLWYKVWQWATADGRGTDKYTFCNTGNEEFRTDDWQNDPSRPLEVPSTAGKYHPVIGVIWMDAIVWCNAYSEMTGKEPVYYTDDACTEVLRISSWEDDSLLPGVVKRKDGANGYRLPTFAEWEYVARGGEPSINKNDPWMYSYVGVNDSERIGEWVVGVDEVTTMPVKSKKPNYLGLFDIVGNAAEWCWDTEELWGGDPNRVLMGKSISWHWWSSLLYFAKECGFNHNCSTAGFRVVCSPES